VAIGDPISPFPCSHSCHQREATWDSMASALPIRGAIWPQRNSWPIWRSRLHRPLRQGDGPAAQLHPGGWFPLLLAGAIAFLMLTWRSGVRLVERARARLRQPEEDLIETAVSRCQARLPGTAVFLASAAKGVPLALTQFVKHNQVLHQRIILVTVVIEEAPRISDEDRAQIVEIIPGITRVILHYGF